MLANIDTVEEPAQTDPAIASAEVRRILAERVLRLVSLAPTGIAITSMLQIDRILNGPLVKLSPEGIIALIREMLENGYLEYVAGTSRLGLSAAYR
jgi:hypothetical protein